MTVLTVVWRGQLILQLGEPPLFFLQFGVEHLDRDDGNQQDEGGDGSRVPDQLLVVPVPAPVAGPHAVTRPVDVAMELEETVAVPDPEEEDEEDFPDEPQQHYPLAELAGPAYQGHVDQETDDGWDH